MEQDVFLSKLSPDKRERRLVLILVAASILCGIALAPFAPIPLGPVPAFIPIYESALAVSDFITAILLFGQLAMLRSRALLILAGAYLYTGLMQIPHLLSFPGAFSPTGLMGAGSQTTAWLYMFWHASFPLAVIAYAFLKSDGRRPERLLANGHTAILKCVAIVIALVFAATLLTTWGHELLPPVMIGNMKSVQSLIGFEATWVFSIIALGVLWRRKPHTVLDLWLMVVMAAWICDGALSSVFNVGRFDLGFYVGRAFGFFASNFVLVILLIGTTKLYGRVVESLRVTDAAKDMADEYARRLEGKVEASEQQILRSQEHLARAQRIALVGSTEFDLKTGRFHWSEEFYRLLGLDPATTPPGPETYFSVLPPEGRAHAMAIVERMRHGEDIEPFDLRVRRADGEYRWLHRVTETVRDAGGGATSIVSTFQDITERKLAEEELKRTKKFLDTVIDNLPGTLVVKDAKDLRYVLWNRASEELIGISRVDAIGKTDHDIVPKEQADAFAAADREILRSGQMLFIPSETVTTRNKGKRIIQVKKVPVSDDSGEPLFLVAFAEDITERKQLEADLELNREVLDRAQAVGQLASAELDLKTGKVTWSEHIYHMLGLDPATMPPTVDSLLTVIPPEDHAFTREVAARMRRCEPIEPYEFRIVRPDGTERWIYRVTEYFRDDTGKPYLVVTTNQDITARKQIVEARARAEAATLAKSSFLANMSHEIRTPMNAVIGLSDLALKTELTAKQQDYLVKIKSSAMALLGVINDSLDFSKIEAGKLRLENSDFDLRTVLDSISTVSALRAADKGLELLFSVDPELPTILVGDSLRLGQVLHNLVSNAIKFTQKGEVVVEARIVARTGSWVDLAFSVSDTGIGMDAEVLSRLFQPFTQADSSTTRKFGGTGLGLTISRQLVEMMGGMIAAESTPGRGTTFRFKLRLGVSAKAEDFGRLVVSAFAGLRALVIDDSAMARTIIETMLTQWGMAVDTVASGPEGLNEMRRKIALRRPYDLMVIDWRMPELDGVATARAILTEAGIEKAPAVVLMTAYGRDDLMDQAQDAKIDAFLAKPISASTLLDTISTALSPVVRTPLPERKKAIEADYELVRGARVLLVDDNDINRQVGEETLLGAGIVVDLAENGRVAIDKVFAPGAHYDAVLMDVQMPVMDGLEASVAIRARFGSAALPIIALTANAMAEERQKCLDAGMNDHVAKPIEPRRLIEALARWIKRDAVAQAAPPAAAATEVPKSAPSAAPPPDLPVSLPPFDITAALVRVNGKRPMLRRLFLSFGEEFENTVPEIRRLLDEGKTKEAERAAHTLKSAAATLGADAVAAVAGTLEQTLRQGKLDSVTDLVAALEGKLVPALAAVATLKT